MVVAILLVVMLAGWAGGEAVAQQRPPATCPDSATTQAAINGCAAAGFEVAERRLDQLVAELRDSLPASERAELDSAQRAWSSYAAAQCRLEAAPSTGGTAYGMQVTTCRRSLVERRIAELAPLLCPGDRPTGRPCAAAERYRRSDRTPSKRRQH